MQVACFSRRPGGWSASLQNLKRFVRLVLLKKRHLTSSSEKLERKTCMVSLPCSLDFCVNELFLAGLGEPNWLISMRHGLYLAKKGEAKVVLNPNMPIIFCFFLPFYCLSKINWRFLNLRGGII
jgi:hypothetical protein